MKRILLFAAFCFLSFNLLAQYGGTASVRIQNSDGESECLNVVYDGGTVLSDRTRVQENLENQIKSKLGYSGKMKSQISFSIFNSDSQTARRSGRASVKVINEDGESRYISTSVSGYFGNKNDLAGELLIKLNREKSYGERFIDSIQYSLN